MSEEHVSIDRLYEDSKLSGFRVYLRLPEHDIDAARRNLKQTIMLDFNLDQITRIQKKFDEYDRVICYTDGACHNNPGSGGAGVAFFGIKNLPDDAKESFDPFKIDEENPFKNYIPMSIDGQRFL